MNTIAEFYAEHPEFIDPLYRKMLELLLHSEPTMTVEEGARLITAPPPATLERWFNLA